uniref:folate gamma-glutamyl hydrolase n=1 Tax=Oryza meridionalis TaxID=40149 RepID=A0A0E0DTY0_9ORYZ
MKYTMGSPPPHRLLLLLLAVAAVLHRSAAAAEGVIRLPSGRACAAPADPAAYDRPVIGIVSHPGDGAGGRVSNGTAASYIAASYVKFVESAGARVVPLIYNEPEERLLEKLSLVNGVLFTGGWVKSGPYFETIKKVFQYVLDKNDAGIPFPLFAQCLGFELVTMIVSKVYVSTVQANKYPITCTQWHPEKAIFEFGKQMIPHSEEAVQVTQNFANYFISQARKSQNRPPADKVLDNLIYNYSPTFIGKKSKSFDVVYIFS